MNKVNKGTQNELELKIQKNLEMIIDGIRCTRGEEGERASGPQKLFIKMQ